MRITAQQDDSSVAERAAEIVSLVADRLADPAAVRTIVIPSTAPGCGAR
jgi:hypothetical protein